MLQGLGCLLLDLALSSPSLHACTGSCCIRHSASVLDALYDQQDQAAGSAACELYGVEALVLCWQAAPPRAVVVALIKSLLMRGPLWCFHARLSCLE
jgi:hypothetical protein